MATCLELKETSFNKTEYFALWPMAKCVALQEVSGFPQNIFDSYSDSSDLQELASAV